MKGIKRSIINKYFSKDILLELIKITKLSDCDNNDKGMLIKDLLRANNIPFNSLGSGTNRMAVQIDGYAVKIALDLDGATDNKREMLYSKPLQPYVVKCYEGLPNGLVMVCEFVEIFNMDDFHMHKSEMEEILSDIAESFFMGDVGITTKNYVNWGTRMDGSICILDFAYVYSVEYRIFGCSCSDEAVLNYDKNFVNFVCPLCGRKYTFGEVRRKITREDQEREIGDIRRIGYNLTKAEEEVELNPEFEPSKKKKEKKKSKKENEIDRLIKEYRQNKKDNSEYLDYWDKDFEEEKGGDDYVKETQE